MGPDVDQGSAGIEIEPQTGMNGQNWVYSNEVACNAGTGISVHSVASLYLSGYSSYPGSYQFIHDNTGTWPPNNVATVGIDFLYTQYGSSAGVTLANLLSINNSGDGITFQYDQGASGPGYTGVSSDPDGSQGGSHCLQPYTPAYDTSPGLSSRTPYSTNICPAINYNVNDPCGNQ